MIWTSLKRLCRSPGKALAFFLLLAAATALLTFAAASMTAANQRIDRAQRQFSTIATISQDMRPGDLLLHVEMLDFPGAEYIVPPETRPMLMAFSPGLYSTNDQNQYDSVHVFTFTVLEDHTAEAGLVKARVERSLYDKLDVQQVSLFGTQEKELEAGDLVHVSSDRAAPPFAVGKTYIAHCFYQFTANDHTQPEFYVPYFRPFSTQCNRDGQPVEGVFGPAGTVGELMQAEEVDEDFWEEGGGGAAWLHWAQALANERHDAPLPVIPTNGLTVLPSFHSRRAYVCEGREISEKEFAQGARVCLLPQGLMARNLLRVGDTIRLPLRFALYGYATGRYQTFHFNYGYGFSPLNAQGEPYDTFWDEEYEIVGMYRTLGEHAGDLAYDGIIVPSRSIDGSWEQNIAYCQPMNSRDSSFQIPNGKIAEFNTALHNAVPEAAKLRIVYDDNGYEDVMQSLKNARLSAGLLLAVGALAALTVTVLLMYFFVVKERRRTAIERSLGFSKGQCRASLMWGILLLALPAVVLGSGASWALASLPLASQSAPAASAAPRPAADGLSVSIEPEAGAGLEDIAFSRDFSLWAENEHTEADIQLDEEALALQRAVYFAAPGLVLLCVALLALAAANGSLHKDPLLLLGGQQA